MTLDEQLLVKAKAASEILSEAERKAQLARADYHTMIRRLHLGGASLREIAEALGISHQRVQQIVEGAGGSWWSRVWRTRNAPRDAVCTFCGRPPSEVDKLIAGPNVYVCDACVVRAEKTLARPQAGGFRLASGKARCSFCGKTRSAARAIVVSDDAGVCAECLSTCRGILDARAEG